MSKQAQTRSTRDANLNRLFAPRSVAVVGASNDATKAGHHAMKALAGFPGEVWAVHPREREVLGRPCVSDLSLLPHPVDLAILAIPSHLCADAVEQAAALGVGAVWIIAGGFSEIGEAGARLQERIRDACLRSGMRLLGPNTSGFIHPSAGCVACFVPGTDRLHSGHVAVVAQSGGINLTTAFLLDRLGHGVSLAVGLGNAVDVDASAVLEWLAQDSNTHAIALHLEGVENGRRLYDTLRLVTPRKPVVALVAGRCDVGEFAQSHTGNLMGSRDRTVAALTQAGAMVVDSTEELAQAAAVMSMTRLPATAQARFGLVTGQAGPGLLIADGLKAAGLELPELSAVSQSRVEALLPPLTYVKNPVDTGRPGPSFAQVVQTVGEDARVDAVLVFGLHEPDVLNPVQALVPAARDLGKPIVFGSLGLESDLQDLRPRMLAAQLPLAESPERLVLAARMLAADARAQWRLGTPAPRDASDGGAAAAAQLQAALDEDGAKRLLESYGLATPARRRCRSHAEAHRALAEIGGPIVAKIASSEVLHKTEAGGVQLGITDTAGLSAALDILDRIPLRGERAYLLERMAPTGVDLIVGGLRDPSWGPCVMIGLGGVTAEALHDTAVRLAPVSAADVQDMLQSLRGAALLDGFRGLPRCDRAAIIDAVCAVARLLQAEPQVVEVEVNPLRVYERGALGLDALVVVDSAVGS
ncbi:MAG: hypothetical protein RLY71_49 [Pseudomonadota bacterium]|jgi:acetyltransferase